VETASSISALPEADDVNLSTRVPLLGVNMSFLTHIVQFLKTLEGEGRGKGC